MDYYQLNANFIFNHFVELGNNCPFRGYLPNKIERGRLMLPPSILFENRLALLFSKLVLVVIWNRITIA